MAEKFCLKWNDFHSNVSNSFSLLRNEDYLHDVTIVTNDNEQVAAHKLVLSACSAFFKNIFKRNKHPNPLLCLEGVSSDDIRNIMDYIYNGEVQIFQEDLDRFLSVAQRLKLEGLLTKPDADQEVEDSFKNENVFTQEEITKGNAKPRPQPSESHHGREIAKVNVNTDISPDNISEVDRQINQHIVRNLDGTYSCQICGKKAGKNIGHIKNHIETHIEGLTFNCPMCEKSFRSTPSLGMHKSKFHKNVLF